MDVSEGYLFVATSQIVPLYYFWGSQNNTMCMYVCRINKIDLHELYLKLR